MDSTYIEQSNTFNESEVMFSQSLNADVNELEQETIANIKANNLQNSTIQQTQSVEPEKNDSILVPVNNLLCDVNNEEGPIENASVRRSTRRRQPNLETESSAYRNKLRKLDVKLTKSTQTTSLPKKRRNKRSIPTEDMIQGNTELTPATKNYLSQFRIPKLPKLNVSELTECNKTKKPFGYKQILRNAFQE